MSKIESLQDLWSLSKTLQGMFSVWCRAYPCPKCKEPALDFSAPRLGHPIVCRGCLTLFDFKPVNSHAQRSRT